MRSLIALVAVVLAGCAAPSAQPSTKDEPQSTELRALATPFAVSYSLQAEYGPPPVDLLPGELQCPRHQERLQASLAPVARAVGIVGTVRLAITVRKNQIVKVEAVSGPEEYFEAAVLAARGLTCYSESDKLMRTHLDLTFSPF